VGAALCQDDPPDRRATGPTRLAVPLIDAVQNREAARLTVRVPVVGDGAALMADAGPQHLLEVHAEAESDHRQLQQKLGAASCLRLKGMVEREPISKSEGESNGR